MLQGFYFFCCKVCSAVIMVALWNGADHYIFALWFLLSIYLSIFLLFSSPNLSHRGLDVCHTSTHHTTHGVALLRI